MTASAPRDATTAGLGTTTILLTTFAMIAFAANSLLCRMALGIRTIDPMTFTTIRLVSGALVLLPLAGIVSEQTEERATGSWTSGIALFAYAAAFSLAYVTLSTGTGALILFGAVQVTMIGSALRSDGLTPRQWIGSIAALGGLVYLVFPGITAPDPVGALLMCVSGIAWGVYSIRGVGVSAPVSQTARNFLRASPLAIAGSLIALASMRLTPRGVFLALVSGILTSGLGYVIWYRALRGLAKAQASVVQLLVPVIAAFGGVILLSEDVSTRLVTASVMILGGVTLAVLSKVPTPETEPADRRS